MSTFKASNGVELRINDEGKIQWRNRYYPDWNHLGHGVPLSEGLARDSVIGDALSEFFQHESDTKSKPWLAARVGEVWVLGPLDAVYTAVGGNRVWFTRADVYGNVQNLELNDSTINRGRRIWPEASNV